MKASREAAVKLDSAGVPRNLLANNIQGRMVLGTFYPSRWSCHSNPASEGTQTKPPVIVSPFGFKIEGSSLNIRESSLRVFRFSQPADLMKRVLRVHSARTRKGFHV